MNEELGICVSALHTLISNEEKIFSLLANSWTGKRLKQQNMRRHNRGQIWQSLETGLK